MVAVKITPQRALAIADKYYSPEGFAHAVRVMEYTSGNPMIPQELKESCIVLAILHDLLKDTTYRGEDLDVFIRNALCLLTRTPDMDYISYIHRIKQASEVSEVGKCAWWVKIADMKDHLAQRDTLTEKLRDKYLEALPHLL